MRTVRFIGVLGLLYGCGSDSSTTMVDEVPTPYRLEIPQHFSVLEIPVDNPMTVEGVELGKRLFFDPILSIDSTRACASCHIAEFAFTDSKQFSVGVAGQTKRNSMPLMNAAWLPVLFWDGRAPSLEAQALLPVEDAAEMGESWDHVVEKLSRHPEYPHLFNKAFPGLAITAERAVKAIAQFERTLVSGDSRYDRFIAGRAEFTPQEQLGLKLFSNEIGDCFHCHGAKLFTDNRFHNNGLDAVPADSGLAVVTGSVHDVGKFKTPSLRNVEYTAPYMHDGRFEALEEVVEFYNSGVQQSPTLDPLLRLERRPNSRRLPLTDEEKKALVAFLKTLSDPDFIQFE